MAWAKQARPSSVLRHLPEAMRNCAKLCQAVPSCASVLCQGLPYPPADPFDDRDGHGVSEGFVTAAVRRDWAAESAGRSNRRPLTVQPSRAIRSRDILSSLP